MIIIMYMYYFLWSLLLFRRLCKVLYMGGLYLFIISRLCKVLYRRWGFFLYNKFCYVHWQEIDRRVCAWILLIRRRLSPTSQSVKVCFRVWWRPRRRCVAGTAIDPAAENDAAARASFQCDIMCLSTLLLTLPKCQPLVDISGC